MYTEDFDWEKAENKQYTPMFIPNLTSDTDVKYFSRFFTSQNCMNKDNNTNNISFNKNKNSYTSNNIIKADSNHNNSQISSDLTKHDYTGFTYINNSEIKIKEDESKIDY